MTAFLASFLVRSIAVGLFGLMLLLLAKRRSAALQHSIAVLTIAAMAALPLVSVLAPTRKIESDLVPVTLVPLRVEEQTRRNIPASPMQPIPSTPLPLALVVWATGSAVLLIRLGHGLAQIRAAIARSKPVLLERGTYIKEDPRAAVPMTAWFGSTVILLPAEWSAWPEDRLDRVLAHERAHISRGDWFAQMFAALAGAILWPNPMVHILAAKVRSLAERAADDQVLRLGSEPSRYAADLLDLSQGAKATAPSYAIPMAAKADVARRVEMILSKKVNRRPMSRLGFFIVALSLVTASVPFASWAFAPAPVRTGDLEAKQTFTLKVRVYSLATQDPMLMGHRLAVKSGTLCTECHRDKKTAPKLSLGAPVVYTASKEFAEKLAKSALDDGGVLLMAPTIITRDAQKASITVSATGENKRTTSVSLEPHATAKESAEISVDLSQSIEDRVVSKQSGKTVWEPGRVILITDKDKRRLAIIEVSTTP